MKFGTNICKNGRFLAKSVIFNMAADSILDFAVCQFCIYNQLWDPILLSLCQIWCESVQKWPSCGLITDFKIAADAILDFELCEF